MIKIGLECSSFCNDRPTGIARYTTNLIKALLDNEEFQNDFYLQLLYKLSRFKNRNLRFLPSGITAKWHLGNILPFKKDYNIVHCTGSNMISWDKVKKIATIYDLAIFKEQFQYEAFSPKTFRDKKWNDYKIVARKADAILTISQSTKNDIVELLNYPEENIYVAYPGVDKMFFRKEIDKEQDNKILESLKISGDYLLFIGAVSVRKNLINIIKAYSISGLTEQYKLILAGGLSHGKEEILSTIKELKLENRIQLPGHLPDSALPVLYSNASAFLFPTFYEGFGLPILEAMSCRAPVVIGNIGAAPEIAQGYAIEVDPFDVDSIAEGIKRSLKVESSTLDEAERLARTFRWSRCAKETIKLYKQLL